MATTSNTTRSCCSCFARLVGNQVANSSGYSTSNRFQMNKSGF
jgi:hypothetical protein